MASSDRPKRKTRLTLSAEPNDAAIERDLRGTCAVDTRAEGAPGCCAGAPTSAASVACEVAVKRPRLGGSTPDPEVPAVSGRERHMEERPVKGANPHYHSAHVTPSLSHTPHSLTLRLPDLLSVGHSFRKAWWQGFGSAPSASCQALVMIPLTPDLRRCSTRSQTRHWSSVQTYHTFGARLPTTIGGPAGPPEPPPLVE